MQLGRVESREGFAKGIGQVSHNLGNARALKGFSSGVLVLDDISWQMGMSRRG